MSRGRLPPATRADGSASACSSHGLPGRIASAVESGELHHTRESPMLRMLGNPRRFCDGVTRREALSAGGLSVLGGAFNLPSLLALEQARPAAAPSGKAKNVLLLYLHGGAPTQDMFD